jgi:exonuclease VII small subunit
MSRAKKGSKETDFEAALERLEGIVKHLEEGDLPLEESLRLFEAGGRMERLPFDDAEPDADGSDSETPEGR